MNPVPLPALPGRVQKAKAKKLRVTQACTFCRRKKIKCDGKQPMCSSCQLCGVDCNYDIAKKRGPRKGYITNLEERLLLLEQQLTSATTSQSAKGDDFLHEKWVGYLVDTFFQRVYTFIPILSKSSTRQAIKHRTISLALLYSIMAASGSFADLPAIKMDLPYLTPESLIQKALGCINETNLIPNLTNIQFWVIMSFVEYARGSANMAWIYAGIAMRFCQELGFHKEKCQTEPAIALDGSFDSYTMAMRRKVFWCCFIIDKLTCAGTHRPHCMESIEPDAELMSDQEILVLSKEEASREGVEKDSLGDIDTLNTKCIIKFSKVDRQMNQIKTSHVLWSPLTECQTLDNQLRLWYDTLPEKYKFSQENLEYHRHYASQRNLTTWLGCHTFWHASMILLHRGSLLYKGAQGAPEHTQRIQTSIEVCQKCLEEALPILKALGDHCFFSPYLAYPIYVFATVLMTPHFSRTIKDREKSRYGLDSLYELAQRLSCQWPTFKKLTQTIHEMTQAHLKLYGIAHKVSEESNQKFYPSPQYLPYHLTVSSPLHSNNPSLDYSSAHFLCNTQLFGRIMFESGRS
ncbi:fungal-specific transcription factor domain-containing protein [Sporodiniella umbellata]|nr:fungal-specific transcription factor domain-containing protein [Sporodiniella umbellata]